MNFLTGTGGSGLARDGSTSVILLERGACIAGKSGSHKEKHVTRKPCIQTAPAFGRLRNYNV